MSELQSAMRCEACGGLLEYSDDRKKAVCLHCGNEYFFKEEKSNSLVLALNLANQKRAACDFDGAAIGYKAVLEENPNDAEANWGLAISIYGIEYVEDPRTKKRIPTCRRTIKESILDNEYYKAALANATPEQRELYREKAEVIDRLQKKIKRQLEDEEEYDVFISFKSTDDNGRPTRDRQIARTIYDELKKRGIKTFYSEVTLKNRIGEDYEPIIYKALYSCKFFILVATSEENMNAAWVKNEWSRFRDRVQDESLTNASCAVFDNLNVNELPPFLKSQGIDLKNYPAGGYEMVIADNLSDRFGLTNKNEEAEEIKRQIEEQKKFQRELEEKLKQVQNSKPAVGSSGKTSSSLLLRAKQFAEAKEFKNAIDKIDEVLDTDPTNSEAWLNQFYFKQRTTVEKGLTLKRAHATIDECKDTLEINRDIVDSFQEKNFRNAVKYADQKEKERLVKYQNEFAAEEQKIRAEITENLLKIGRNALLSQQWDEAKETFSAILYGDKENGAAHWGLFLRDYHVKNVEEAVQNLDRNVLRGVIENKNFLSACKFADAETNREVTLYKQRVSEQLSRRIAKQNSDYERDIRESQRLDTLIKQNTASRDAICQKARTYGLYDKELFTEKQGYKYNRPYEWDGFSWVGISTFIAIIPGLIVAAFICAILDGLGVKTFLGVDFDQGGMPLMWLVLLATFFVCGVLFIRIRNGFRIKRWEPGFKRYQESSTLGNQVIDLNAQIDKASARKKDLDKAIKEEKEILEKDRSILEALSSANGNKG